MSENKKNLKKVTVTDSKLLLANEIEKSTNCKRNEIFIFLSFFAIKMQILALIKGMETEIDNASVEERTAKKPARGIAANEAIAAKKFSNETWVHSDSVKLQHEQMPPGAEGIIIAKSKLPTNPTEEHDLVKEIKSAIILINRGSSVTLIPRIKDPITGKFLSGPDAIVDGTLFEFKEVTGGKKKVGKRFMESRRQENNVYIRVANPSLTKQKVLNYFGKFVNNKDYKGGYKGNIIFSFGDDEKTYFFKIEDFKKP